MSNVASALLTRHTQPDVESDQPILGQRFARVFRGSHNQVIVSCLNDAMYRKQTQLKRGWTRMSLVFWLKSLEFSDGTSLPLKADSTLVIVGPNNAGKSKALHDIMKLCESRGAYGCKVVRKIRLECMGTKEAFSSHFGGAASTHDGHIRGLFDARISTSDLKDLFSEPRKRDVAGLAKFFVTLANTETRLEISKPAKAFHALDEAATHPIQTAYADETVEGELSESFSAAFSTPLFVNRSAGSEIPLHVGEPPKGGLKEFLEKCREIPRLHEQGDGMRSFAGCLLYVCASRAFTIMIDEPEAFLHPPQARQLGSMLVKRFRKGKQLVLSTHSGDILRGVLDAGESNVTIVRLMREGSVNKVTVLAPTEVSRVWNDPALRFSNVLDGIFHQNVVVCEADSDCRFFQAIASALGESNKVALPDAMFTPSNGKPRLPVIAESLRKLGVTVTVVADFDALREQKLLEKLVAAQGGEWKRLETHWRIVDSAVRQSHKDQPVEDVRQSVASAFGTWLGTDPYTRDKAKTIGPLVKAGDAWDAAKRAGLAVLPSGDASNAAMELLRELRDVRIHVIESGELESFHKSTSGKSAAWVNAVLQLNLVSDPDLRSAREFVARIFPSLVNDAAPAAPPSATRTLSEPSTPEASSTTPALAASDVRSRVPVDHVSSVALDSTAASKPVSNTATVTKRSTHQVALYLIAVFLVVAAIVTFVAHRS